MQLEIIDWAFIAGFFTISLTIGAVVSRQAGKSSADFFLSGRNMPWWLLGFSMVATTFAADTPLFVTNVVRKNGVAGNWEWWAFLLTGMLTVFVYAKLWRRSGVTTDLEFYELRYSGKPAAFLRGFRAIYLGVFFNVAVMANVTLAAIKIGHVMLGLSPMQTILVASSVAVCFSAMGGLRGVLITDFLLFIVAMVGAIGAAIVAVRLPEVGGLEQLFAHENVRTKMDMVPAIDFSSEAGLNTFITLLLIPLAVQWWAAWYPGAEPGGGGYIAQRMLAAKDEKHAVGATLFFNAAHYALRPWPWIIVAFASLVVFPDLDSLQRAFPDMPADKVDHDLAYPAMLTFLPPGLLGLVVASLISAYMSTISTHLNWGSSYIVNDFWKRFLHPQASEKELVRVGRASTVLMMVMAGFLALQLESALQGFKILLQIGAGTGLLFILRWFWWRINAYSEITAMVVSLLLAIGLEVYNSRLPEADRLPEWIKFVTSVGVTTVAWILVTIITPADTDSTLRSFYRRIRPGGPGWKRVIDQATAEGESMTDDGDGASIGVGIICMLVGSAAIYSALFAIGYWLYGETTKASILTVTSVIAVVTLIALWGKLDLQTHDPETSPVNS